MQWEFSYISIVLQAVTLQKKLVPKKSYLKNNIRESFSKLFQSNIRFTQVLYRLYALFDWYIFLNLNNQIKLMARSKIKSINLLTTIKVNSSPLRRL